MAGIAVSTMGHVYPELTGNQTLIADVIEAEEEKFIATLDTGLSLVERLAGEASSQVRNRLTGEEVFRLYDTYGFPAELTAEIARERGLSIDREGFEAEMEKQRERARGRGTVVKRTPTTAITATHGSEAVSSRHSVGGTRFIGYRKYSSTSKVRDLIANQNPASTVAEGSAVDVILDKTPFYGEMGGQVGDTGEISGTKGKVIITNTVRTPSHVIMHRGKVVEGSLSVGDEVDAKVDIDRRLDIARNHTATHLLQAALRQTLGSRVYQKGSLVEPERFRFDFSQLAPIADEELKRIQRQVNQWVRQNLKVEARTLPYSQAIAEGAIALFEEKYGEEVRMLEIGKPAISKELCGGTHVSSTGEIGVFLITSESSIGTGLHRIEATTGRDAESLIESRSTALQRIAKEVESSVDEAPDKVKLLLDDLGAERRERLSLERELSRRIVEDLPAQAEQVSGVTVLAVKVPELALPILREMGDMLRGRLKSAVIVLATVQHSKPSFLAMVTPDLVAKGFHAGDIINQVAKVAGGGGGGKPGMAQAGGRDASKVDEALKLAKSIVARQISSRPAE